MGMTSYFPKEWCNVSSADGGKGSFEALLFSFCRICAALTVTAKTILLGHLT